MPVVCDQCVKDTVNQQAVRLRTCLRCGHPFCEHFAAKADPIHYCMACLGDLTLNVEEYSRIRATVYTMEGDDWIFLEGKANSFSTEELVVFIEFNKHYLQLLLKIYETRRLKKAGSQSEVKLAGEALKAQPRVDTISVEKKTTTTTKLNKKAEQALAMINQMLAQGLLKVEDLK